jgi:hypothetical protein
LGNISRRSEKWMDLQVVTCSYSEYRPDMGQPVRISLGAPRWWKEPIPSWSALWSLTPRRDYLYASDEVYIEKYTAQLERHGVPEIVGDFERIAERAQKDTLVLMCFEKLAKPDGGWCHRTLFAVWWLQKTGELLQELGGGPIEGNQPPGTELSVVGGDTPPPVGQDPVTLF